MVLKNNQKTNYWKVLTYIIYAIVIIFAFLAISAKFSFFGIRMLVVKSGSMEPTIKTGSLVIDKTESIYKIGDIVTFKNREKPTETTTHRITNKEIQGNINLFTTRGDANDNPDSIKINQNQIIGKVIFKIPYLGYVVAFSRTWPGVIILIIIPATIIIYDEVNNIKKELILRKKRGKKAE